MRTFFCALSYFSRVPVRFKRWPDAAELRSALAWLPLIGALGGCLAAAIWWGAAQFWSLPLATLLAMLAHVVWSGAMHEDGFADACDGLGVWGPREKILQVLKDPQMGTFGVLGLILLMAFRYTFWSSLDLSHWYWIPLTEAMSRIAIPAWSWLMPYARPDGPSKAPFLRAAPGAPSAWMLYTIVVSATVGVAIWLCAWRAGALVIAAIVASALPILVYRKKIGGVTGDVLGAAQQCAWGAVWLALIAGRPF